jgi:hypothetical protein
MSRDARRSDVSGRGPIRARTKTIAVIVACAGVYFLALALVGFLSDLLPHRPLLPIVFAVVGALLCYEALVFWPEKRRSLPAFPGAGAFPRRPPGSWAEARRRFLRISAFALPAFTALGAGVGLSVGSGAAAVGLGVSFGLVYVVWFVVIYRIGRRQWANGRRGPYVGPRRRLN